MRKVEVLRAPINYVVIGPVYKQQIAWFVDEYDAEDFVNTQNNPEGYEIAEARR